MAICLMRGQEFGLVVRAAGWHAGDPGSILGRDGLCTFGCIPQRFESALVEILRYINTLIYLFYFNFNFILCNQSVFGSLQILPI
jgi:hypothetical protein